MRIAQFDASNPPRPPTDWDQVREQTLSYLREGEVVMIAMESAEDAQDPDIADVPIGFRTDGVWIWSMELEYYGSKYSMPVDPELMAHLRARDFTLSPVGPDTANEAWTTLMEAAAEYVPHAADPK